MEMPCRVSGWAAPSVSMTASPWLTQLLGVCAHAGTRQHTHPQASWGGTVCKPDPLPVRECWAWSHPVSEHTHT